YGIVHTIDDLKDAITPKSVGTQANQNDVPDVLPLADGLNLKGLPVPVFAAPGTQAYSAESRAPLVFAHRDSLDLREGTIAFNFSTDSLADFQVLFSKDASGRGNGGHITAYLNEMGDLTVRVQDQSKNHYLQAQGLIEEGRSYDFALSFGPNGIELSLDGIRTAFRQDVSFNLLQNEEYLIVGATGWSSTPGQADRVHNHFNGTISDFVVLDRAVPATELRAAGFGTGDVGQLGTDGAPDGMVELRGTEAADMIIGTSGDDMILADGRAEAFDDVAAQLFRLYQATLGRDPDMVGFHSWHGKLTEGEVTLGDLAAIFVSSNEFNNRFGNVSDNGFVTLLYQNVLNRSPDATGLARWTELLETNTLTRAEVVERFSKSGEFVSATETDALDYGFAALQASFTDDVFRLYQATLGRNPDKMGFESWTEKLALGLDFEDAIGGFVASREFLRKYGETDDAGFITLLYNNVLDRAPDAASGQIWVNRLQNEGWDREDVVAAMAQSREFREKTSDDLINWMRSLGTDDVIEPGAGQNVVEGGIGSDRFVFKPTDDDSSTVVLDLEAWDVIDLEAFDYATADDALGNFSQQADGVLFQDRNVDILFEGADLRTITEETLLL
ncbi:MAG: DUF4214 domain-containing protein, partial [Pseudomonadota bacterium]